MTTRRIETALLSAVALLLAWPAVAGEGVELRLKLHAGQVLRYEGTMEQDMELSMPQGKMTMKNSYSATSTVRVLSVEAGGNLRLEMTTERMKSSIQSPMMQFEYDSAKPEDRAKEKTLLGRFCALQAAGKFTATVDPSGKVVEHGGMEEVRKKLAEEFPESAAQVKMMTGEDAAANMLASFFCALPPEPKKVGETWSVEKAAMGMMTCKTTMKIEAVENGSARVVPAGLEVTFGDFGKPGEAANPLAAVAKHMKVTKSEMTGEILIDTISGAVRESKTRMILDYGMKVPGQEQQVDYHLDQRTSARLLPAEEKK